MRPYWEPYSGQLFNALPKPQPGTPATKYNIRDQPSWFCSSIRHGERHDNPAVPHVNIRLEAGALEHLAKRNTMAQKASTKADDRWAGKRLRGQQRLTAAAKAEMTADQIAAFRLEQNLLRRPFWLIDPTTSKRFSGRVFSACT